MSSNASGDAPRRENSYEPDGQPCVSNSDVSRWRSTHETWKVFGELRKKSLYFDVVLRADDGQTFPAHRLMLCTCGQYFRSLFSGRWDSGERREIGIPGVRGAMMVKVLQFVYTRELPLATVEEAKQMLIVANHLGIEEIVHRCAEYLKSSLCSSNCVGLWNFSRIYYCQNLRTATKEYILFHILEIARLPETSQSSLWNLGFKDIQLLFEDDQLNARSEKDVLLILTKWIYHDPPGRKQHFPQLLCCVRWFTMSENFVASFVENNRLLDRFPDTRNFMESILTEMRKNASNQESSPSSSQLDENGNCLPSASMLDSTLRKSLSSYRYPHSVILVVGGWCGETPIDMVEMYEPRSRRWSMTNGAFPNLLKRPRAYHSVVYLDGWMYMIGGFDGFTSFNSCDRYDIMDGGWQQMCGMHSRRCYVGVTSMDSCIYAVGGFDGNAGDTRLKSAEKFIPSLNAWVKLPDMLDRRSDAGVCSLRQRIYVAGGFTGQECLFSVEFLHTDCIQWTRVSPMRVPRSGVSVVAYRGSLVVLGGFDGHERLSTIEVYDPVASKWSTMPPMLTKRSNFTACVIEDKLTVLGGFNGKSTCPHVEFFDDRAKTLKGPGHSRVDSESESVATDKAQTSLWNGNNSSPDSSAYISTMFNRYMASESNKTDVSAGRWSGLPSMSLSRSALSCCVVSGLSPSFLHSAMSTGD